MNGEVQTFDNKTFVPGFDASKFQDSNETAARPDFKKAYKNGMRFCWLRVCGNGIKDEDFDYNWPAAADAGLLRAPYGFLEYRNGIMKSMTEQAERFVDYLDGDWGELPAMADYEQPDASWPALPKQATSVLFLTQWYGIVDAIIGRLSGLYGNRVTMQNLSPVPTKTLTRPFGVAQWPLGKIVSPDEIALLKWRPYIYPWPKWTYWQPGVCDGKYYGMESAELDLQLFNGTLEELRAFAGVDDPVTDPETPVGLSWAESLDAWARSKGFDGPLPNVA